jgi:hypothetical protein
MPLDAVLLIAASYWPFLAGAAAIGLVTGFVTGGRDDRRGKRA